MWESQRDTSQGVMWPHHTLRLERAPRAHLLLIGPARISRGHVPKIRLTRLELPLVQVALALSHALSWRSEFGQATVGHAQKQAVGPQCRPAALGTRRTARGRTRGARSTNAVAGRRSLLFCCGMRVALPCKYTWHRRPAKQVSFWLLMR